MVISVVVKCLTCGSVVKLPPDAIILEVKEGKVMFSFTCEHCGLIEEDYLLGELDEFNS